MNNLLQRDISISRIPAGDNKYEYQLIVKGDPCIALVSEVAFDFGLVNINPETGEAHMEMHHLSESIQEADMKDENTFIVSVTN